jgi:uncharacterized protein (TIGR03435 family)
MGRQQEASVKNRLLRIIVLAALPGGALLAQDITGTWQGTLSIAAAKQDLRIVLKISNGDAGALKAVLYSIDQGGGPGMAGSATVQGPNVKVTVPGIGGTYEGKLDSDGVNLTGTWTQGSTPLPLNLKHVNSETAWPIPEPPARPKPMTNASPAFDAASIKPSKPEQQGKGFTVRGREFLTFNTSVVDLITFAYGLHARQITGGPAWLEAEKYDLDGKPEGEGQPNDKQWKIMIQKLLADRCKLTFHHEQKELSVYAITVGKDGSKLTKSEGDPNGLPGLFFRGLGDLPARNATMADFAGVMQTAVLDRPVVDQTGLTGRFDFILKWTPDEFQFTGLGVKVPTPTDNPNAPPDLFNAIQQQLGLKLVATKAPVDVLVVDRVEKPSAN